MTNSDQRRPGGKSGKRKQKKARKDEHRQASVQAASAPIEAAIAQQAVESVAETAAAEPVVPVASFKQRMASVMPQEDAAPAKPDAASADPVAPAKTAQTVPPPVAAPASGIQAIANAYRDYTRKSLEDAQSFAEKLTAARSLDKAVEAQTEFARQACETFADNSRKIRELHRELFWQTFRLPSWPPGRTPR